MLVISKTKGINYFNEQVIEQIKHRNNLLELKDVYPIDEGVNIITNNSYKFAKCYSMHYVDENTLTLNVIFKNSVKDRFNIKPEELQNYIGEDKIRDIFVYLSQ